MQSVRALVLAASLLGMSACDSGDGTQQPSGSDATTDTAGEAACERFRTIAGDAFAETLSSREIASGLQGVGNLAADSTDPAIRRFGVQVGAEANARTLISGAPDQAQDGLADACNSAFPL